MNGRRVAFRRSAAWHEAAHATAGYLLARAAPMATLEPPPEAPAAGFVSWSGPAWAPQEVPTGNPPASAIDAATAVAAALVSAAGPACDAMLGLPEADVARRGRFDLAAVRARLAPVAEAIGEHPRGLELWACRTAGRALRMCWPHVRRLARALDRLGTLRPSDLERLMADLDPTGEAEGLLLRAAFGVARRFRQSHNERRRTT